MPEKVDPLVWAPMARRDLRRIWRYYATEGSVEIADKIVQNIVGAADRLVSLPFSGRPRDELKPGWRSILVHPYFVFYQTSESRVEITRVLHERRDLAREISKFD
jgi:toxin ParE1/3/4